MSLHKIKVRQSKNFLKRKIDAYKIYEENIAYAKRILKARYGVGNQSRIMKLSSTHDSLKDDNEKYKTPSPRINKLKQRKEQQLKI